MDNLILHSHNCRKLFLCTLCVCACVYACVCVCLSAVTLLRVNFVCLSVCVFVCMHSVCLSVCQHGQNAGDLQWQFADIEQRINVQHARDSQLLKLLKDTQAESRGEHVLLLLLLLVVMMMMMMMMMMS